MNLYKSFVKYKGIKHWIPWNKYKTIEGAYQGFKNLKVRNNILDVKVERIDELNN